MKQLSTGAILSLVLFSSCHFFHGQSIRGDGHVVTQSRSFSNFNSIDAGSAIDVYVTQDTAFSVKVEVDNNLQEYVEIEKEGDVLHIRQRNNTSLDATGDVKVYVSAPLYKKLEASGASHLIGKNLLASAGEIEIEVSGASDAELELKAPKVSTELSGASGMTLKGETKDFSIDGGGASHAKCFDLLTENADVDISGASSAEVYASVKLEAKAGGASHIRYKGAANYVGNTSGAASISKE